MARTFFVGLLGEEDALNLLQRRDVRHPLRRAGGLATLSLLVAALMAWTPSITAGWNQSSAEATLWQLTNGDRVNNGVRPIQQNTTLVSIARWRSRDMIVNNYFSHNIPACGGCLVFHYYDTQRAELRSGPERTSAGTPATRTLILWSPSTASSWGRPSTARTS